MEPNVPAFRAGLKTSGNFPVFALVRVKEKQQLSLDARAAGFEGMDCLMGDSLSGSSLMHAMLVSKRVLSNIFGEEVEEEDEASVTEAVLSSFFGEYHPLGIERAGGRLGGFSSGDLLYCIDRVKELSCNIVDGGFDSFLSLVNPSGIVIGEGVGRFGRSFPSTSHLASKNRKAGLAVLVSRQSV